jgi:hypothetical protein
MAEIRPIAKGSVRGYLHEPADAKGGALVLTHGAGSNCQAPLLLAVARTFADAGWWVLRCDLPFRQRRNFGPPTPARAAEDRNGLRDAAEELRSISRARICLGGHSYGGRQASMLLADEPSAADGLLLLSYPLHPPNKPHELRTGHFPRLHRPSLFVHGTNDPFGSIEEIQAALTAIPAATELVTIQKAGHDLGKGSFDIAKFVLAPFESIVGIAK